MNVALALQQARIEIPLSEARLLLQHVLSCAHADLVAHPERLLAPEAAETFNALTARRARGEPIAYLTGSREFYGRSFSVTPAVLIPRPETELLVILALEKMRDMKAPRILDLGTGSGVLAITLMLELPRAGITAVDHSLEALAIARTNAARLGARVRWMQSDWLSALHDECFDLIVANPPYVAVADPHLHQGDLRFEPQQALISGGDGLDDIRRIIGAAPAHLDSGGWLLFEHGYDQAQYCRTLLASAGFNQAASWRDLAQIERVSGGMNLD